MPADENKRDVVYRDQVLWAIDVAIGEARKERPSVEGEARKRFERVITHLESAKLWLLSKEHLPF